MMKHPKIIIKELSDKRYKLLDILNKDNISNDSVTLSNIHKDIDDLSNQIYGHIKTYYSQLDVDFILYELTLLGDAPNLLYDDNGHFAVTSDGTQSIPEVLDSPSTIIMGFIVPKEFWHNTIREALNYYINI